MVRGSFMGESLLRIQKIRRTTFSKTKAQKKTVKSPKTNKPERPQPHSSCWSRLFYSLTHMAVQTHTHTHSPALIPRDSQVLSHPELETYSSSLLHGHFTYHQSGLVFTGVSFNQKCQCEPLVWRYRDSGRVFWQLLLVMGLLFLTFSLEKNFLGQGSL